MLELAIWIVVLIAAFLAGFGIMFLFDQKWG